MGHSGSVPDENAAAISATAEFGKKGAYDQAAIAGVQQRDQQEFRAALQSAANSKVSA